MIDAIIFDCDGVLIDSEPIHNRSLTEAIGWLGFNWSVEDVMQRYVGHTMDYVYYDLARRLGHALPDDWHQKLDDMTDQMLDAELKAIPGVAALIEHANQKGVALGVASNGRSHHVRKSLKRVSLDHWFGDHIYSGAEQKRAKPAPDVYLAAADALAVPPERCLVIEDSLTGVRAGCAAGMRVHHYHPPGVRAEAVGLGARPLTDMRDLLGLWG